MKHNANCQDGILCRVETVGTRGSVNYRYVEIQTGCVNACPVVRKVLWYNNTKARGNDCKHWCAIPQSVCCKCEVALGGGLKERAPISVKEDLGVNASGECEICEGVDDRKAMV